MKKVLLVLGASSECGCGIVQRVHNNYQLIYAHYCHNVDELQKLKQEIGQKLILVQDDFLIEGGGERVLKVIEENGYWPDDVIHLSAPKYQMVKFTKTKWDMFEDGLKTSLRSCVIILQKVMLKMQKEKKDGRVLIMLSSCTNNVPPRYISPYVVSKYALLGLVKELSVEYADKGIMVNGISPGMMETQFLDDIPELIVQQNAQNSPFGRNLTVDEVVPVIEFMLSDGAARITGQNIIVSGGI